MVHSTYTAALQLSLRVAVAAGLAIGIGQLLRLQFPIYAMISALVVTDLDPAETRKLGLPRLAGTVLRATLGALICLLLSPSAWEVGLGVLLAMFLSHLLRLQGGWLCMRHRSLRLRRCSLVIRSASHDRENDRNRARHTDKYCAQAPARAIRDEIVSGRSERVPVYR
jgi:hypothetical protein